MKGCPNCRQLYAGDQIRFCRWDGATLQQVDVKIDNETTKDLLLKSKQKTSAPLSGRLAIKIERRS